jgi:hypothetical protein
MTSGVPNSRLSSAAALARFKEVAGVAVLARNLLFQSARACAYFAGAFCALAFGLGAVVCFAITRRAILL